MTNAENKKAGKMTDQNTDEAIMLPNNHTKKSKLLSSAIAGYQT